jgi:hypothetical protein
MFPEPPFLGIKALNLTALLISITIWFSLSSRYLQVKFRYYFYIFLCLSTPFLMIHVFIWSESLFLLFFSGYLFYLEKFLRSNINLELIKATLFCFCMVMQRNVGLFILTPIAFSFIISKAK